MRNLLAALFLILSLNTRAQQPGAKPLSSPEPGVQVRTEFLRAYNAKEVDAVVALYAEDATLVSDGGTFKRRDESAVGQVGTGSRKQAGSNRANC